MNLGENYQLKRKFSTQEKIFHSRENYQIRIKLPTQEKVTCLEKDY